MIQVIRRLLPGLLLLQCGVFLACAEVPDQRIQELKPLALKGDGASELKLAMVYDEARNSSSAAHWFRKAAAKGYVLAATELGCKCLTGDGVPRNKQEAVKWFRMAAEHGDALAQYDLASCYLNGEGVTRNLAKAVRWCRVAADQNLPDAQYMMGVLYGRGDGVPQDNVRSYEWVSRAAERGHPLARQSLETLKRIMTPDELSRATKNARIHGADISSRGRNGE